MSASGGLYDELQRQNRRSTRVLLTLGALLVALLLFLIVGYLAGPGVVLDPVVGPLVVVGGSVLGLGLTYLSTRAGPAIALRASKAKPASREAYPELHNVFDEVCVSAGILQHKPKLYVVDDPAPNAFATGLSLQDSHVAVTTGLLRELPRYELRAVLAHEVAHVLNDDVKTVTYAVATAGLVAILSEVLVRALWIGGRGGNRRSNSGSGGGGGPLMLILLVVGLLAVVLAPLAAQLIRFSVSRQREYLADATAADLLRDPQSMVNALRRLDGNPTTLQRFETATAHLWFEEPNDVSGKGQAAKFARRFATHPSLKARVERLASLNAGTVRTDAPLPPRPDGTRADGPPPPTGQPTTPPPSAPPPGATPYRDVPPPPPQ